MADGAVTPRIPPAALGSALLGLVPFLLAVLAALLPQAWLAPDEAGFLGLAYGAVSLSFIGGIRWGLAVGPYGKARMAGDFWGSALPALAAWAALALPAAMGLSLLIAAFLLQALWDVMASEAGRFPAWFARLRMIYTIGAVIALFVLLLAAII